jgi:DNA-binding MarR family transcriptional regulator
VPEVEPPETASGPNTRGHGEIVGRTDRDGPTRPSTDRSVDSGIRARTPNPDDGPPQSGRSRLGRSATRAGSDTTELPLASDLGFRFSRASRALRRQWAERLRPLGLTPPQSAVLRALVERPGLGLRELARQLDSDPMTTKHVVDELERRGWLASSRRPGDGRARSLRPTTTGARIAETATRLAVEHDRQLRERLGPLADAAGRVLSALETRALETRALETRALEKIGREPEQLRPSGPEH